MPKVSINILTKNRSELLQQALNSVFNQSFKDIEVVIVNDGSNDNTDRVLKDLKFDNIKIINHYTSLGITLSRQEALNQSMGEYIAILDDDDEWIDVDKLKKQVEYLDGHPDVVLVGGGISVNSKTQMTNNKFRPETNSEIHKTMLLRNNFFTSTVMFRREAGIKVGGFIKDEIDLCEDYDLWLKLGKIGQMYNFQEPFVKYRLSSYNKEKFRLFLQKQLKLIRKNKAVYPGFWLAWLILKFRLFL